MIKIKYEKPTSLDVGQIAAIQGATCSGGNGALDGCNIGTNPAQVYMCPLGNIADTNCDALGNTAGSWCSNGGNPQAGRCSLGSSPL